jgi:FkbM family methyltransferase
MRESYSQDGEDLLAQRILDATRGTYLDIGSGHPVFNSNTYLFYLLGWSGIAVDPNPKLTEMWIKERARDTFINSAFHPFKNQVAYFMHPDLPELNSTSKPPLFSSGYETETKALKTIKVPTVSAEEIASISKKFDLLNIDTEGMESDIMKSLFEFNIEFDLAIIEVNGINLTENLGALPIVQLCSENGMKPICKTLHNIFFINVENSFARCLPSQMLT